MAHDVLMQRGPFTFQWRPCVIATWKPRPMNRDQRLPQVLTVTGVPDGVRPVDVMHQMERTMWAPNSISLTTVDWADIGVCKIVLGAQQEHYVEA